MRHDFVRKVLAEGGHVQTRKYMYITRDEFFSEDGDIVMLDVYRIDIKEVGTTYAEDIINWEKVASVTMVDDILVIDGKPIMQEV